MNKTTPISLSLITLFLAGCTWTPDPVRTAGLNLFVDPATGTTYSLPLHALSDYTAETRAGTSASVGMTIGVVAQLDALESRVLIKSETAALPAARSETAQITPVAQHVASPLKLRLDTEFASFAAKRMSFETT